MTRAPSTPIVNAGYRSTHYWVVGAGGARLLVDIGWPGTLGTLKANLRRLGVPLAELRGALATHYHIDHAGLAEELKREGVPLLVLAGQEDAIPRMKQWTKPHDRYVEITAVGNVLLSFEESRGFLANLGIAGEVVPTPGHTDHCVSLLLDDGSAFTGDLPAESPSLSDVTALASWKRLRERGATRVYPGHGPVRELAAAPDPPPRP